MAVSRPDWILVVDDDDDLRAQLSEVLVEAGYDARGAADGVDALRMIADDEQLPCVVLLDLLMPRLGGVDTLRRLRQSPRTASLPVIVLSGVRMDETLAGLAPAEVFSKPVSAPKLLGKLGELCKHE